MLAVTDIAADVAAGNTQAVEEAFRALVAWPDDQTIEPPSPDVMTYILEYVAEALTTDPAAMPAALVDALDKRRHDPEMLEGDDYAAGATFVLSHIDRWREGYERGSTPSTE